MRQGADRVSARPAEAGGATSRGSPPRVRDIWTRAYESLRFQAPLRPGWRSCLMAARHTTGRPSTFRAACERWPGTPITLRQGACVIEDSRGDGCCTKEGRETAQVL